MAFNTNLVLKLGIAEGESEGLTVLGSEAVYRASIDGLHQVFVHFVLWLLVLAAGIYSNPEIAYALPKGSRYTAG